MVQINSSCLLFEFCVVSDRGLLRLRPRAGTRHSSPTFLGGHKAVVRPVPIPNTAVKHSLADGSGFIDSARVGCRQFFRFIRQVGVLRCLSRAELTTRTCPWAGPRHAALGAAPQGAEAADLSARLRQPGIGCQKNVLLAGNPGTGKTPLAATLGHASSCWKRGRNATTGGTSRKLMGPAIFLKKVVALKFGSVMLLAPFDPKGVRTA